MLFFRVAAFEFLALAAAAVPRPLQVVNTAVGRVVGNLGSYPRAPGSSHAEPTYTDSIVLSLSQTDSSSAITTSTPSSSPAPASESSETSPSSTTPTLTPESSAPSTQEPTEEDSSSPTSTSAPRDSPPPESSSPSPETETSPPISTTTRNDSTNDAAFVALQQCADCSSKTCEFKDMQSRGNESRTVAVGTPVLNCRGSETDVDQEISISESIQETWSTTSSFSVGFGTVLQISFQSTRSRADTKAFSETVKFVVPPGKKARCVALVTYELTDGVVWKDKRAAGVATLSDPRTIDGRDIEVVNCGQEFSSPQPATQPSGTCSNAASRIPLSFAVWMMIWGGVTVALLT
ncbi:hypothetical protein BKA62DRAFT_831659 [Auriculariales sp. MPI-PUGE-AT-0066]|nr:hypothetical protein BKA62DRAFT_831659 [Auriculariales sp. MPI-PUGE-AT-0066]